MYSLNDGLRTYWIKCLETGTGNLCTSKQRDVLDVADLDHWQLHDTGQIVLRLWRCVNFQRTVWDQNHLVRRNDKLVAAEANSIGVALEHFFLLQLRKCAGIAKQHPWPQSELMWCNAMPLNVQRTRRACKKKKQGTPQNLVRALTLKGERNAPWWAACRKRLSLKATKLSLFKLNLHWKLPSLRPNDCTQRASCQGCFRSLCSWSPARQTPIVQ